MTKPTLFLTTIFLLVTFFSISANGSNKKLTFNEVLTASDNVIVAFFTSDTVDLNLIDVSKISDWKINGNQAKSIERYITQADKCDHHIYLETDKLKEGKKYLIETPYGKKEFTFSKTKTRCEAIKVNQVGYSALAKTRYANFAIWTGTGGSKKIETSLPDYEVINSKSGKSVFKGKLTEFGHDETSGDYVYRINLADVPEGGPYKIAVEGYGCSYPFGIGGEFSKMLAYKIFRAQYLQRCGCPVDDPKLRKDPCHTLIYDVDGPIGEANIVVTGNEKTFKCYGGYHDAGDSDRRAYHMSNSSINLMIYEAFPEYFTDLQYDIPGKFTDDFHIASYSNNIPDIIDEAAWGVLVWEYLQNEDGGIQFGTETKGYAEPFDAPYDKDIKKYGTVKVDNKATCAGAGLFMHMARMIKPYNAEKSDELKKRAENAMQKGSDAMADPEKLYYHIQRYLLTGDNVDHQIIKNLYATAKGLEDNPYDTPGYSLNDKKFDNIAYIYSYIVEKKIPTDPVIVDFFKTTIKNVADKILVEYNKHAYPIGTDPTRRGWGNLVKQPQYATALLLNWRMSGEQKYFDTAAEIMSMKLGLNPIGISYVTGLGSHSVQNIHDRESVYLKKIGKENKPGITVFGPGVISFAGFVGGSPSVIPGWKELPKERQYVDDMNLISCNEFTIFESMAFDGLYTILAGGGKWNKKDPFK